VTAVLVDSRDDAGASEQFELALSLRGAVTTLERLVAATDALSSCMSGAEAEDLALLFARGERLCGAGKTVTAGRVADTGTYRHLGFHSPQQWLARSTGTSDAGARRALGTYQHLRGDATQATRRAFVGGQLSGDQAHEIARVVSGSPEAQELLLRAARTDTLVALRERCQRVRSSKAKPKKRTWRFTTRDDGEGTGTLQVKMPSEWLFMVLQMVNQQADAIFKQARDSGPRRSRQQYQAEALIALVLWGLINPGQAAAVAAAAQGRQANEPQAHPPDEKTDHAETADEEAADPEAAEPVSPASRSATGDGSFEDWWFGDDEDGEDPGSWLDQFNPSEAWKVTHPPGDGSQPAPRPRPPRVKAILNIDTEALLRGHIDGEERCELAGIGSVPVRTAERLMPGACLAQVISRGTDVVHVTHYGRRATAAMLTALEWRGGRCTNSNCDNTIALQIDHRVEWATVLKTELANLDPLCPSACHKKKTELGWALVRGKGRRPLVPPGHPLHPSNDPGP
jgi:hypothetical protein